MSANYLHGIETTEIERGMRQIRQVKSAVIAILGTAPAGPVNTPVLSLNERDAAAFGPDIEGFSLPRYLDSLYQAGAGTVVVINVLNPATHRTVVPAQDMTFAADGTLQLPKGAVLAVEVKSRDGSTTYAATDYVLEPLTGKVVRTTASTIPASGEVSVAFTYADPSKVTAGDIIGDVDAAGLRTGIKALGDCFNLFGLEPKILIAPDFSSLSSVSAELTAATSRHQAVAYIDAPIGATPAQVIAGRGPAGAIAFNTSSDRVRLCYPHVKVYDARTNQERLEPLSVRAAALRAKVDLDLGYWWSSSNQELLGVLGLERPLTARIDDPNSEVNLLNEVGVTTVFNSFGTGFRLWGNRTAAWPTVTHMRNFENVRRTKDLIDESIRFSSLQFQDRPVTQALIDSIVESVNGFGRKLIGDDALLGFECWYDPARNPKADVQAGHLVFNYKLTVPPPFERGTYETEITDEYLVNLKGAN
ncbi:MULTISPECIES: phage tail sheath subtilisin-like domain-containing protein [unclassified Pseudomonas]|uniref:phage tail sheath subtilisin-like domain-containing protein n=1 Tax=unclassified Pseudomonas TaxID=196821 RepID=UPI002446ACDE|nr:MULTISPECIES: phage tail sheath subtilisin-like domain-containing protein [unclassified Pseudomonas]MDH0894357.1 phage tail sheath subtilisin-like domain-containing protein [Pseudomonas sp. GD03875]MDH1063348.1 phage tail sheath subtilisin-like domain-containing protein [Pseudomonas sp. GD03985]